MEERRRYPRYPIYCPIEYKSEKLPREPSITLNISEGGALISTTKDLQVNSSLIARVSLKDEDFFVRGRVVHIQKGKSDSVFSVGVEFMDRPPRFTRNFYEELEAILYYQKKYAEETGEEISLAEASIKWYKKFSP